MDKSKRKKMEAAGWKVGSAQDFLDMASTETALVAIRVSLAESIRARRTTAGLTQAEVAKRAKTTRQRRPGWPRLRTPIPRSAWTYVCGSC